MMRLTSGVLVLPVPASAQGVPAPAWGASVEGLRLGLALVDGAERKPVIEVTFENAGPQDALLNLGFMVGNGRTMVPHAVRLMVRGASFARANSSTPIHACRMSGGRIDDLVVGLPRAVRHAIRLALRDFWCAARKRFPMAWPAEMLHVTAQFNGGPAVSLNLDMPGMRVMHFWRGTLASGAHRRRVEPHGRPAACHP